MPRDRAAVKVAQVFRHQELREVPADGVRAAVAERLFGRRIEFDDLAEMVHRDDAIERGFEHARFARA